MRAYTLTFDGRQYDESAIAREMASHAGAIYQPIAMKQADLATNFRAAVIQSEIPFINGHTVAKYMLSRAVRESGYKVVLTGEGSDEILAGYPHFRRDMLLHHTAGQDPEETARLLQQIVETNQVSRGLLLPEGDADIGALCATLLGFVPSWLEAMSGTATRMHGLMRDDFMEPHRGTDVIGTLLSSLEVLAENDLNAIQVMDIELPNPVRPIRGLGRRIERLTQITRAHAACMNVVTSDATVSATFQPPTCRSL